MSSLAVVALILILFRDGLEVDAEMLQREWRLPLRKLALAMPLTAGLVALAAKALTDLTWTEALLLGALAVADRPGPVLGGRDQPEGAAQGASLPEPGVGPERRSGAARRPGAHGLAHGGRGWIRVVGVRAPGRGRGLCDRHSRGPGRDRAAAPLGRLRRRDQPAPESALRDGHRLRRVRGRGAAARGQRLHRRVRVRDRAGNPPSGPARVLREALGGRDRVGQARDLRRVRLAAHPRRLVLRAASRPPRSRCSPCSWRGR